MIVQGLANTQDYIPAWNENTKQAEAKQVVCTIDTPTVTAAQGFTRFVHSNDGTHVVVNLDVIMKQVKSVKNLSIKIGADTITVKDGAQMLQYSALTGLVDELSGFIVGMGKK